MGGRVWSKVFKASRKPSPGLAMRFALGTLTPSKVIARVSEALITTAERTTLGELCNTLHLIPRFQNVRSR